MGAGASRRSSPAALKAAFAKADTDSDGTLSASELGAVLRQAGVKLASSWDQEQVGFLLKALDENVDGKVEACEFERCADMLFRAAEAFASLCGGGSDGLWLCRGGLLRFGRA